MRITWNTYNYLRFLIEDQMEKLDQEYRTSLQYIKTGGDGTSYAREIYDKHQKDLNQMLKELKSAAQASYKDHPSKEMREFWGIEE